MMRVLHVMASGARGGGADHLLGLLPELRLAGVTCLAAVGTDGPLAAALSAQDFDVTGLHVMDSRVNLRHVLKVVRVIDASAADIVHFHGTRAAFFGAAARSLCATHPRTVYTAHGLAYRKPTKKPTKWAYLFSEWAACAAADDVISVSSTDLADLRQRRFLRCSGAHIPNAVDTLRFKPGDRRAARSALQLPQDAFIVGTTARLVRQKAVMDLLTALEFCPGIMLGVIGDGPERERLASHSLTRAGRVVLLGARDDVAQCLPAWDAFALASHWEGEPIALLEAMACGLPTVATRTAGAEEILQGGAAGRLVDVAHPAQLAAAFTHLRDTPAERQRFADVGRAAALRRSHAQQAAQVMHVYRRLPRVS